MKPALGAHSWQPIKSFWRLDFFISVVGFLNLKKFVNENNNKDENFIVEDFDRKVKLLLVFLRSFHFFRKIADAN